MGWESDSLRRSLHSRWATRTTVVACEWSEGTSRLLAKPSVRRTTSHTSEGRSRKGVSIAGMKYGKPEPIEEVVEGAVAATRVAATEPASLHSEASQEGKRDWSPSPTY